MYYSLKTEVCNMFTIEIKFYLYGQKSIATNEEGMRKASAKIA